MNYRAIYDRIVKRARGRGIFGYTETHHIVPRCLAGGNSAENLVEVTPEEHYVLHQLLAKMYPQHIGLAHACVRMSRQCTGRRAFGWLRRKHALAVSIAHSGKQHTLGHVLTEEHKQKIAAALLGKKKSIQARQKLSAARIGLLHTDEAKAKMSAAKSGKPLSMLHRQKIGAALRGVKKGPFSAAHRAALSAAAKQRWAAL